MVEFEEVAESGEQATPLPEISKDGRGGGGLTYAITGITGNVFPPPFMFLLCS